MATIDEERLVREARNGNADAIGTLFDRHWISAWRTAFAVCGSRADADDIAQDSLVHAFGRLRNFDGRRPFGTWLNRIVVNRAIDHQRRGKRRVSIETIPELAGELVWPAPDPRVGAAVARLDHDRRTAVMLRYALDWTPTEIADALGVPVGTVNSRLARALAELRVELEASSV